MNNYVVKTEDKIVQQVIEKIDQRSLVGQAKYGAMMMEEVEGKDKDLNDFLIDVQEEIMDALLYICLLYTSPSPRDGLLSRMPSSA